MLIYRFWRGAGTWLMVTGNVYVLSEICVDESAPIACCLIYVQMNAIII